MQINLAFLNFNQSKYTEIACHGSKYIVQKTWQLLYRFTMMIFDIPNNHEINLDATNVTRFTAL